MPPQLLAGLSSLQLLRITTSHLGSRHAGWLKPHRICIRTCCAWVPASRAPTASWQACGAVAHGLRALHSLASQGRARAQGPCATTWRLATPTCAICTSSHCSDADSWEHLQYIALGKVAACMCAKPLRSFWHPTTTLTGATCSSCCHVESRSRGKAISPAVWQIGNILAHQAFVPTLRFQQHLSACLAAAAATDIVSYAICEDAADRNMRHMNSAGRM